MLGVCAICSLTAENVSVPQLNTHLVVDALKSDETLQYIRALEQEKEKLHESIRQLSGQLQNMKVSRGYSCSDCGCAFKFNAFCFGDS